MDTGPGCMFCGQALDVGDAIFYRTAENRAGHAHNRCIAAHILAETKLPSKTKQISIVLSFDQIEKLDYAYGVLLRAVRDLLNLETIAEAAFIVAYIKGKACGSQVATLPRGMQLGRKEIVSTFEQGALAGIQDALSARKLERVGDQIIAEVPDHEYRINYNRYAEASPL